MIRISNLKLAIGYTEHDMRQAVSNKLKLNEGEISKIELMKRAIDARKKDNIHYVCTIDVFVRENEKRVLSKLKDNNISIYEREKYKLPIIRSEPRYRPIVVGFGPAGMFASLTLAQCGMNPLIIERGECIEERKKSVERFWKDRILDENSNIQFGEGGAGAFSDGKLTTGIKDSRIRKVLEDMVSFGAPREILYDAKPHVGTDKLEKVVINVRKNIQDLGGEFLFNSQFIDFTDENGKIKEARIKNTKTGEISNIRCKKIILALGHSARDTFEMLHEKSLEIAQKSFAVGVRIEHKREMIDTSQYGDSRPDELGAADYKLSCHLKNGRGVYTFCMCPGGAVVAASSEKGMVVTNGMSYFKRDLDNSNSAILVGVTPNDFKSEHPLAGVYFQREIEKRAFNAAGEDYSAPVQKLGDFMADRATSSFEKIYPSYRPAFKCARISECLPAFVTDSIKEAIPAFAKRLKGFDCPDAVLTAPETRSSSPVKLLRNDKMQSEKFMGMFLCGEGAGYAGGIMSAAVDGIKCAEILIESDG